MREGREMHCHSCSTASVAFTAICFFCADLRDTILFLMHIENCPMAMESLSFPESLWTSEAVCDCS